MAPARAAAPPIRTDAFAFTWFVLLLTLLTAILTTPEFRLSTSNWLGLIGERLARIPLDSLGYGSGTLLLGWAAMVLAYLVGTSFYRIVLHAFGWGILCFCTSWAADRFPLLGLSLPVSLFGPGGSIGALTNRATTQALVPPLPTIALILMILLGVALVATRVAKVLARVVVLVLQQFSRLVEQTVRLLRRTPRPPEVKNTPSLERKNEPIISLVAEDQFDVQVLPTPAEEIPITRPQSPMETPQSLIETPPPRPNLPSTLAQPVHQPASPSDGYEIPSLDLLADADHFPVEDHEQRLRDRAALLEKTFLDFNLKVKVVGIHTGPVITQYEVALETGLRLNKVTILADDLALNLGVGSVRIVAPLPGRNTVGIELPNDHRQTVRLKELITATHARAASLKLPIFLGKDVEGRPLVYDMADMPHLLIAGRTGTGKSVCLNAILNSFLFTRSPEQCRLILIDPKKVEFSEYGRIPHLMHPVVVDDKKAEAILAWAVDKMEERYELLRKARVRNIASYNELGRAELHKRIQPQTQEEIEAIPSRLPYIVVVVDEVGDLLMTMKKEVESHIIRLAQKSRAAGIHLILATQKPTVDVITGLIKSNLPARICFQVASRADSAVVLDEKGAEKLLGQGDMLFLQPRTSTIIRGQGTYVDDREIERVCAEMEVYEPNYESELLNLKTRDQAAEGEIREKLRERDPLYEQAIEIVVREQRGSTSLLQRALGIGYGRASRLIDFMAEDGIVGGYNGSNAREVLLSSEDWASRQTAG
jgi:S-DNA-T family DNA segregation ATPase FtsK/SpoIIIE